MDNVNKMPMNSDIEGWHPKLKPLPDEDRLGASIPLAMLIGHKYTRKDDWVERNPVCTCEYCIFPRPILEPIPPNKPSGFVNDPEADMLISRLSLVEEPEPTSGFMETEVHCWKNYYALELMGKMIPYLPLFEDAQQVQARKDFKFSKPNIYSMAGQGETRPAAYHTRNKGSGPIYIRRIERESEGTEGIGSTNE